MLAVSPVSTQAAAKNWESIGASPEQGIEVFADTTDGSWCKQRAAIKIVADDIHIFSDSAVNPSLQALGQQMAAACAQMTGFVVYGYKKGAGKPVFQAIATGPAWAPSIDKAPAASSAPARPASSSGHASSTEQMFSDKTVYGNNSSGAQFIELYKPDGTIMQYSAKNGHYYGGMKWSVDNANRLCKSYGKGPKTCFELRQEADGSYKGYDPSGKWYQQFTTFVSGDTENLTQNSEDYWRKVEEKNNRWLPIFKLLELSVLNSPSGGGNSGAGMDAGQEFTNQQNERRIQQEMYKDWKQ